MVEHCCANGDAMGSNPVEAPAFFRVTFQVLKFTGPSIRAFNLYWAV